MNEFNVVSSKFLNELRNGPLFTDNPTEFTDDLVANVGERIQLQRVISVETSVFAVDFGSFNYSIGATYGVFQFNGNWNTEGISVGATVNVIWDGITVSETIQSITGTNGNTLLLTRGNLDSAGLIASTRSDFEIRVTSAPDRIKYQYGLNPLSSNTNNYQSPLSVNTQAYYNNALTGSFQTLSRVGVANSWNLGTVEIKFNGTTNNYVHEFEIKHTFKVPYFVDGELGNIQTSTPPTNLIGSNTLKYGYGLFLAQTNNNYNRILQDAGLNGSVGYYGENFNGFDNDYEVQNLLITNTQGSLTLEGTTANTVTFQIKNNISNFVTGQEVVVKHTKLPTATQYQISIFPFSTIWMTEDLNTTVGAASTAGSIITALTVGLNADNSLLDVSYVITYNSAQQGLILDTDNWLMSVLIDNNTLDANVSNRVNLKVGAENWSFNDDVFGLIQNNDLRFFNSCQTIVYPRSSELTDCSGWDGDFTGMHFKFQTKASEGAYIDSAIFRLLAFKNDIEQFEITSTTIPISKIVFTNPALTTYKYQLSNASVNNSFNIPLTDDFNKIVLNSIVPNSGDLWQDWRGSLAFEKKWRDWIPNSNVDNVFYDATKPNNNKNIKTSNYSNLNGFDIYAVIDLNVHSGDEGLQTPYRLKSDTSTVLDFDVNGGNGVTGVTSFYDNAGALTDNIYSNQNVTIKVVFTHSSGVLNKACGDIFIEKVGQVSKPWRLSTHKNWANPLNPLAPTNTLGTGNTAIVEVISISNEVTFICETNNLNLDPEADYIVYGRLQNL